MIAHQWRRDAVDAGIHALIGEDSDKMVHLSGRMFYVALGAAVSEKMPIDDPDVRILRGAVNAVHDQVGQSEIPAVRRSSIVSGLQAVSRLVGRVSIKSITDSACELAIRMRYADVRLSDFEALMS